MKKLLEGVRVVDLSINVLGPVGTMILGDVGADVIKVETPDGDPMRNVGPTRGSDGMAALFLSINRNKRSVVLDLKRPAAFEALMRLVETADVFVHNMRPQAAARLGIAYEAIRSRNPRIVYASASGFGRNGRYRDRAAYDDMIQGASGVAAMFHRTIGTPRYSPMMLADKFCGHVLASSVAMALFHRERTGEGGEVLVPMFETLVSFNLMEHLWNGVIAKAEQGVGYPRMFGQNHRPMQTKDGYICVVASTDAQWRRLFEAVGRPELASDPRFATMGPRMENIVTVYGILQEQLQHRTTAEWREKLEKADIPNGPMNQLEDLLEDPHLRDVNFFQTHEHPTAGPIVTVAAPVHYSQASTAVRLLPPTLGEHTRAILESLRIEESKIAEICGST